MSGETFDESGEQPRSRPVQEERRRLRAEVLRDALVLALQRFEAHERVDRQRGQPVDLHADLVDGAAEKELVGERLVDEIPLVRVLPVHVPDPAEELPELDLQPGHELARLNEGLLGLDFPAGDGQHRPGVEVGVHRSREGHLQLAQVEAALDASMIVARGFGAVRVEAGRARGDVGRGAGPAVVVVDAVGNDRDRRVERVARRDLPALAETSAGCRPAGSAGPRGPVDVGGGAWGVGLGAGPGSARRARRARRRGARPLPPCRVLGPGQPGGDDDEKHGHW